MDTFVKTFEGPSHTRRNKYTFEKTSDGFKVTITSHTDYYEEVEGKERVIDSCDNTDTFKVDEFLQPKEMLDTITRLRIQNERFKKILEPLTSESIIDGKPEGLYAYVSDHPVLLADEVETEELMELINQEI